MDWIPIVDAVWKLAMIPLAVAGVFALVRLSGFKLTQQQQLELKSAVETSMLSIEEQGIKAWKDHSAKIPGPEKLALAVNKARELAPDGLQKYSDDELRVYTEAALAKARPLLSSPPPPISSSLPPGAQQLVRVSMPPLDRLPTE